MEECILCGDPMTEGHHCSPEGIQRYLDEVMPLPQVEEPAPDALDEQLKFLGLE